MQLQCTAIGNQMEMMHQYAEWVECEESDSRVADPCILSGGHTAGDCSIESEMMAGWSEDMGGEWAGR